ncbi:probable ATP-dependent RNA helicase spindle-E [Anopheles stephensi]|uniref:probable ATP-dependent RNA helicase spindle-E n=1 Tax=Anopheles stephensi TaxID=30069 RepID=UPI001658B827|nr:probable ATP-dependent RNA helicase spindle-E [Anopheles stephensi]
MDDDEKDELLEFFDFSIPFERTTVRSAVGGSERRSLNIEAQTIPFRHVMGTEYAKAIVKQEEARILSDLIGETLNKSTGSRMDEVDDASSMADEDEEHLGRVRAKELMEPIFSRYNLTVTPNKLTIHQSKEHILKTIRENPVVVLQGVTGCGKTTQVPQYLLEDAYKRREWCNIIVTQPRKIAATSIARRVAAERSCELGTLVGFKVGLKEKISEDTRLTYVTTGVLLNKLINSKSLSQYTHIILDEVHEREVDMDFLLIIVRRLLTQSRHTKIILMSATIESSEFAQYFKIPGRNSLFAPQLAVSNTPQHDVTVFYLENLEKLRIDFSIKYEQPEVHEKMYFVAAKVAIVCDRYIDECETASNIDYKPSIIMFLPGINEIDRMAEVLRNFVGDNIPNALQTKFTILKLHSTLPSEEQALVFRPPPPGYRKVILSTNIAESSITIPDVKFVIDFCLHRLLVADTLNNFTSLQTQWASRNNCIQRAGRAGRVMNGRVYRLVNKHFYDNGMAQSPEPEMVRCPLGAVVLKTKLLDMGPPHTILALAMSPPNLSDVSNTVLQLKEVGALLRTTKGVYDVQDGDITYLGQLMSQIPVDITLAKLVVLGYVFSVLEEAIIIAAGMNVKNVFCAMRTVEALRIKRYFANGSASDGIAILNAYTWWRSVKEQGTGGDTVGWCQRYMLDLKSLTEMAELVQEITYRLKSANIRVVAGARNARWNDRERTVVLKVVMAGAFYPNYFLPLSSSERDLGDRMVYTEIGGRNPFRTVFFSGFDHYNYIGPLYRNQIRALLTERKADPERQALMKVDFERSTNKIFVQFEYPPDLQPGQNQIRYDERNMVDRIHPGVYEAIKLRQVRRSQSELLVMHHNDAVAFATENGLGVWKNNEWHPRSIEIPNVQLSVEPAIYCKELTATVTYVQDPNKFYLRPHGNDNIYKDIERQLSESAALLRPFSALDSLKQRDIVAAPLPHTSVKTMGRAKLLKEYTIRGVTSWAVFFMDFGSTAVIPVGQLRKLEGISLVALTTMPDRVFEASLAGVQPCAVRSPKDVWTEDTVKYFRQLVLGKRLHVEIYSVVNRVSMVVLRRSPQDSAEQTINRELIRLHHAQESEESYVSKMNHEKRLRVQSDMELDSMYEVQIKNDDSEQQRYLEDDDPVNLQLPRDMLKVRLMLRGPYSPLEIKCSSTVFSGYRKPVSIENSSLNSVLLDTNPQNPHTKLLVAGCVNETSNNTLIARQTTMMPNIPGLPVLMALIFAPTCQLRKDPEETRVVGLLAGLGIDPHTGNSIYPEHDMSMSVDICLDEEDIGDINALRYTMDSILHSGHNEQTQLFGEFSIESLMGKVKDYLIKILQRERAVQENRGMIHDFRWDTGIKNAGSSKQTNQNIMIDIYSKAIFPLYDKLNLYPLPVSKMEFMRRHCAELHLITESRVPLPKGGILCQLCDVNLESEHALRIHFCSSLHRELEKKILFRP